MIPLLFLAAAAAGSVPASGHLLVDCNRAIRADAVKALADAEQRVKTDVAASLDERECLGLAYVANEQYAPAATAFASAAESAELSSDASAAALWVQAGNASLAAGDAGQARNALAHALKRPELTGQMAGEAHIDMARAEVQAGDPEAARQDLDQALKLVPADPMGWLLSATLARREGDAVRARTDITEAVRLAPDDASVAYEAGNVASLVGAAEAARVAWSHAAEIDPNGPAGQAAKLALAKDGGSAPQGSPAGSTPAGTPPP